MYICLDLAISLWEIYSKILITNVCAPQFCCCYCSVTQSCPILCDPMDCNTPSFPVHHHLLELAQIHVHRISDAIQPSHPLLSLFLLPLASGSFPVSWLLASGGQKYWSFSINSSSEYSGLISFRMAGFDLLAFQGTLKSILLNHTVSKHQFFGTKPSLWSSSHIHTGLLEKP